MKKIICIGLILTMIMLTGNNVDAENRLEFSIHSNSLLTNFENLEFSEDENEDFEYNHLSSFVLGGLKFTEKHITKTLTDKKIDGKDVYNYSVVYKSSDIVNNQPVATKIYEAKTAEDFEFTVGSSKGNGTYWGLDTSAGVKYGFSVFGIGAEGSTSVGMHLSSEGITTITEELSYSFHIDNNSNERKIYAANMKNTESRYIVIDFKPNIVKTGFFSTKETVKDYYIVDDNGHCDMYLYIIYSDIYIFLNEL